MLHNILLTFMRYELLDFQRVAPVPGHGTGLRTHACTQWLADAENLARTPLPIQCLIFLVPSADDHNSDLCYGNSVHLF